MALLPGRTDPCPAGPRNEANPHSSETINSSLTTAEPSSKPRSPQTTRLSSSSSKLRTPHSAPDLAAAIGERRALRRRPLTSSAWSAQSSRTLRNSRRMQTTWLEWDIPAEILWNSTWTRKKANAPSTLKYLRFPFLRTYVREDTASASGLRRTRRRSCCSRPQGRQHPH